MRDARVPCQGPGAGPGAVARPRLAMRYTAAMRRFILALLLLFGPTPALACADFLGLVTRDGAAAFPVIEEEGVFARSAALDFLANEVFLPAVRAEEPIAARRCFPAVSTLLRPLATAGDARAASWLGVILTFQHLLFEPPPDDAHPWAPGGYFDRLRAEGYRWARAGAEAGNPIGAAVLSHLYFTGFGTPGYGWGWLPPLGEALAFLEARAAAGDILASMDLFKLYAFGKHVALDPQGAERHRVLLVERLGWYAEPCRGYARRALCTTPLALP